MLFNSLAFGLFLPVMLAVYWSLRGRLRQYALLVASYVFYGWYDWRLLSLLWLVTATSFAAGRAIERAVTPGARRGPLIGNVVVCLGTLASFKYLGFFRESLAGVASLLGWTCRLPALDVILPIGISFYTFQALSYTIDVYRGARAERDPSRFALYLACFPQLVAGPIMRADKFLPQLARDTHLTRGDVSTGIYRMFSGLFKKMVVADSLALYVNIVFASPHEFAGVSAWIALYAYAFQIYMDFSGYCDVAVGAGRLLGLHFDENFDRPYLARSPSDFWRRWHITLSTWLRDYLYIPLGGSRRGTLITARNVMITMALGGLWHGASWTFVAWGVYHGLLLAFAHLIGWGRRTGAKEDTPAATRVVQTVAMFHLTCVGWPLFRAANWKTVAVLGGNLLDFTGSPVHGRRIAVVVAACAAVHLLPLWRELHDRFARLPALGQGAAAGVCLWTLFLCGQRAQSFIYFRF